MYCPQCGNRIEEGFIYCSNCGAKLPDYRPIDGENTSNHAGISQERRARKIGGQFPLWSITLIGGFFLLGIFGVIGLLGGWFNSPQLAAASLSAQTPELPNQTAPATAKKDTESPRSITEEAPPSQATEPLSSPAQPLKVKATTEVLYDHLYVISFSGEGIYSVRADQQRIVDRLNVDIYNGSQLGWNETRQELYVIDTNGDKVGVVSIDPLKNRPAFTQDIGWNTLSLAISPRGGLLYLYCMKGDAIEKKANIVVIETASGSVLHNIKLTNQWLGGQLALSPDGNTLFVSWDKNLDTYSSRDMQLVDHYQESTWQASPLLVSPDGLSVYMFQQGKLIKWNAKTHAIEARIDIPLSNRYGLKYSSDGQKIYTNCFLSICEISIGEGNRVRRINLGAQPSGFQLSTDGKYLYYLSKEDELLHIWNVLLNQEVGQISGFSHPENLIVIPEYKNDANAEGTQSRDTPLSGQKIVANMAEGLRSSSNGNSGVWFGAYKTVTFSESDRGKILSIVGNSGSLPLRIELWEGAIGANEHAWWELHKQIAVSAGTGDNPLLEVNSSLKWKIIPGVYTIFFASYRDDGEVPNVSINYTMIY